MKILKFFSKIYRKMIGAGAGVAQKWASSTTQLFKGQSKIFLTGPQFIFDSFFCDNVLLNKKLLGLWKKKKWLHWGYVEIEH
jgi:hypothetical protein